MAAHQNSTKVSVLQEHEAKAIIDHLEDARHVAAGRDHPSSHSSDFSEARQRMVDIHKDCYMY